MSSTALLINGKWLQGSGEEMKSTNPFNGEVLWSGPSAASNDVQQAVDAARAAFSSWARTPFEERAALVERFKEQLQNHTEELAVAIGKETGKPLWESRTEVAAMIGKVGISIQAYKDRTGSSKSELPAGTASLRHRPHGVVAVFGPYNFPGHPKRAYCSGTPGGQYSGIQTQRTMSLGCRAYTQAMAGSRFA